MSLPLYLYLPGCYVGMYLKPEIQGRVRALLYLVVEIQSSTACRYI